MVLVWFPNSDLITFKQRPALVVEANNLETGIPQVVVSMITSNAVRRGHPSRVFIPMDSPAGQAAGFRTDSVVTDNLATILHKAISVRPGHLDDLSQVEAALRTTLAL